MWYGMLCEGVKAPPPPHSSQALSNALNFINHVPELLASF